MQLHVEFDVLSRICYTETAFVKIWSQTVHNIQCVQQHDTLGTYDEYKMTHKTATTKQLST